VNGVISKQNQLNNNVEQREIDEQIDPPITAAKSVSDLMSQLVLFPVIAISHWNATRGLLA